jgi:hypothetical protein
MHILDLRIEWAQAQLHTLCWDEEKQLLPEEMQCAVTTHIGTCNRWLSRVNGRSDVSVDISHGLDTYTHCQADIYYSLAVSFVDLWSPELRKNNITVDWPLELAEYVATVDALPEQKSGRKKSKPVYSSDSKSKDDAVESIQFGGSHLEDDTESLVGGEDGIELDGESVLLHLAGYTDGKNSEEDTS